MPLSRDVTPAPPYRVTSVAVQAAAATAAHQFHHQQQQQQRQFELQQQQWAQQNAALVQAPATLGSLRLPIRKEFP